MSLPRPCPIERGRGRAWPTCVSVLVVSSPSTGSGVGAGAWEVDVPLYQDEGAQLETDYYVHNEILQLLGEYGLVGWITLRMSGHYLPLATIAWGLSLYYLMGNLDALGKYDGLLGLKSLSAFGFDLGTGRGFFVLTWAFVLVAAITFLHLPRRLHRQPPRSWCPPREPSLQPPYCLHSRGKYAC